MLWILDACGVACCMITLVVAINMKKLETPKMKWPWVIVLGASLLGMLGIILRSSGG